MVGSRAIGHLIGQVTGTEGPIRAFLDWLRRIGFGERVVKSALAAGVAWEVARLLPDNDSPVLAPLTAIFSVTLTIAGGVTEAVQRFLGVIFGIAIALIASRLLGVNGWTIGFVVLIAFFAGRRLKLESAGLSQMVVSALLVVFGATTTGFDNVATLHLANTIVGTVVGVGLNAMVAPPTHLPAARQAVTELGQRLAVIAGDLAGGLAFGITAELAQSCLERARTVAASLDEVEHSIAHAEESLKYNLMASRQRAALQVYRRANTGLEHAAVQIRIVCRSIVDATATAEPGEARPTWLDPEALGVPLANLLSAVSVSLDHFLTLIDAPRDTQDDEALAGEIMACRRAAMLIARDRLSELMPEGWALLGEALALTGQFATDLTAAANALGTMSETGQA